jgi:hypothetical protein
MLKLSDIADIIIKDISTKKPSTMFAMLDHPTGWYGRIYDDPNHYNYGPVRRLHIMLMQLIPDLSVVDQWFAEDHWETWDLCLSNRLDRGLCESTAQRKTITEILFYTKDDD